MKGLTAYALGIELGRVLAGKKVRSAAHFDSGLSIELEDDEIPYLHIFFISRKTHLIPLAKPVVPPGYSIPVFSSINDAVITAIGPLGLDRIILIDLESKDSWGKLSRFTLRIDLSPSSKAVSLFELPGKRLMGSIGAARSRNPGSPDERPPAKRWSLFSLPDEYPGDIISAAAAGDIPEAPLYKKKDSHAPSSLSEILVSTIDGVDPILSSFLSRRYENAPYDLWENLKGIAAALSSGSFEWKIYDMPEGGKDGNCTLYPFSLPLPCRPERIERYLEGFGILAEEKILPSFSAKIRNRILSIIKKDINKSKKLIANLSKDLAEADRTDELRMYGNLLTTFRHLLRPGMKEIELRDFSGTTAVLIPLDPALKPDMNIKKYFRRAKKGEKGRLVIRNHRKEAEKELKKKLELLENVSKITKIEKLLEYLPEQRAPEKGKNNDGTEKMFRSYILDPNHIVLVGRNDRENDFLTHRFASPNDLWFHAQGSAGSHVILRRQGTSTPREYIKKAAEIAAWFSKARNSSTVPVIYTEKRYVRKPRKSKSGTAVCIREQTIFVKPSKPEDPLKKDFGGSRS
ncbi:MAG: DUF814 domain-containing protein [Candidatus Krumholzibacteriota bacterium]|nr:DUF814 domain-containing protein [Candidatus Krumholzibacteriota bacterium]